MRPMKLLRLLFWPATLFILCASIVVPVLAQNDAISSYPNRRIRLIVGFAPGGGNDIFARLLTDKLQDTLGQPVIVENKPGAGGRLANEYALSQPADGYSLLVAPTGAISIAAAIYPDLRYHPTKSFVPLSMIAHFPLYLVVSENAPVKSVEELVTWAKQHPDQANYATTSPTFTVVSELMKLEAGMPGTAVPYKSSGEMLLSVMSGQTFFAFVDGPPAVPLIKAGKVRALAVTGSQRADVLPDLPAMSETRYPNVDVQIWSGVFVPVGTPPDIVKKLRNALDKTLQDSTVQDKLKAMGVDPGGPSGEKFREMIEADIAKYSSIVKSAGLKFE
jgi:tripartite-type tricarboxylate transporter receptor subunit TctC